MTGPSRSAFGLAGAREENGFQSRGGCARRSSSGCGLSPQWLQLRVCGSPPRSDEPGWPPPSQTSQLLAGGPAGRRGMWPGPGNPVALTWRAPHSPCPPLPCVGDGTAESGPSEGGNGGEEWKRPVGNTLTCCFCPNASPKRGRRSRTPSPRYMRWRPGTPWQ